MCIETISEYPINSIDTLVLIQCDGFYSVQHVTEGNSKATVLLDDTDQHTATRFYELVKAAYEELIF